MDIPEEMPDAFLRLHELGIGEEETLYFWSPQGFVFEVGKTVASVGAGVSVHARVLEVETGVLPRLYRPDPQPWVRIRVVLTDLKRPPPHLQVIKGGKA